MKSGIRSFTLLEMVVVMLLSSIIIAIAYQGYILFYRQYLSFKKNTEANSKISLLDSRIFSDCADSREIRKSAEGLTFIFKDKKIVYELRGEAIIRHQAVMIDTFKFNAPVISMNFNGKQVFENDLVDEIKIETQDGEETMEFRYVKKYGADVIINNPKLQ